MSVLVRDMKMPESCHECVAGYGGYCFVCPAEEDGRCPDDGRPVWCPLIEVPPHGRLIDADRLVRELKNIMSEDDLRFAELMYIVGQPTIIEAEGT